MMRSFVQFSCTAGLIAFTFLPATTNLHANDAAVSYIDDADGRRLAEIEFRQVADGSAARLQLVVSATGPDVEPISGFEGVCGANRYTAEQFDRILSGSRRFAVVSRNLVTGETTVGEVRAGRRGFLPARTLRADGSIDYLAHYSVELPLELVIETGSMSRDRYETEIRVDGVSRARFVTAVGESKPDVQRFESLGGHLPSQPLGVMSRPHFLAQLVAESKPSHDGRPAPPPLGVVRADWAERDLEGKWTLYQRHIAERPASRTAWVPFLVGEKEFQLLEWIAIYQVDGFASHGIGQALVDADAPQWARVAAWNRNNSRGHGDLEAGSVATARPGAMKWWLRKYPEAALARRDLRAQFEADKFEPVEAPHLLPPLKLADVVAHLDAPAELASFGDRTTAEPGASTSIRLFARFTAS